MKKKSLGIVIIITIVLGSFNFTGKNDVILSDLALSNIEALARGETSEEFYQKTGCKAIWENKDCRGKDGKLYSYAEKP